MTHQLDRPTSPPPSVEELREQCHQLIDAIAKQPQALKLWATVRAMLVVHHSRLQENAASSDAATPQIET